MFDNPNGLPGSELCAVEGCVRRGAPQVCIYDDSYHGHGRIHYECRVAGQSKHGLTFREDGWRKVCGEHYDVLRQAYEARYPAVRV